MSTLHPEKFGKYLLLDKFAVGGMAEVFRGKIIGDQGFEKIIVIKKLLPHINKDQEILTHFIDEAKLVAQLHHENIIHIYDFGNIDGTYFIAMEFLFGNDLRTILEHAKKKNRPITLDHILHIISKICDGLSHAHELKNYQGKPLNIIHRDISPQNIFVTFDGQVKILDFGIAKSAIQQVETQIGTLKGKLSYMSPEQAAGIKIDFRSDIFSIGILLYEALTQKSMFEGETIQILSKIMDVQYEPIENIIKNIPPQLARILNKSLQKLPKNRYASCAEMFSDVEDCIYQLNLRASKHKLSSYMKHLFKYEINDE